MSNFTFAKSTLLVKPCQSLEADVLKDLETPQGKSIANLLNDEKNIEKNENNSEENEESSSI